MKNGRFLVGQKLSEISEKLGEGVLNFFQNVFSDFLMASPNQDTDLFSWLLWEPREDDHLSVKQMEERWIVSLGSLGNWDVS